MTKEIAVVGSPAFTTGFRLAGVQKVRNVEPDEKDETLDAAVKAVADDEDVGIAVMEASDLDYLDRSARETVEGSIEPVFVTLGEGETSGLREQIKRAIGIDLMEED
jgi:V/A-type H+-transporting ATPase subunit F